MIYFMMADGFEEAEALVPFDILTRCGLSCKLVSFTDSNIVRGSHGIRFIADLMLSDLDLSDADCVVFPGGGVGTQNLDNDPKTDEILKTAFNNKILIGAICAAPSVLGKRGYLNGVKATCYPGFEKYLYGADVSSDRVVCSGNIITAKGAGAAYDFGYALASYLKDSKTAEEVKEKIY
ncbi:MAG: DJ-1/PfpI family protein [Clostridia bacterium]|nr:DJ-1/PfpI family protein [Clostridia bacterium]